MHKTPSKTQPIVIVDDDPNVINVQVGALEEIGACAETFTNPLQAWQYIQNHNVALVVSDWNMPEMTGMELLFKTRALPHPPHVIIITGFGSIDRAVQAMNQGAFSFLEKPFQIARYQELVQKVLELRRQSVSSASNPSVDGSASSNAPIAVSAGMKDVLEIARSSAGTDSTVLLLGESGTGKEVVADYIHKHSRRSGGPLVKVNCGALPEHLLESELFGHEKGAFTGADRRTIGRFEQANGGTLFLDEIGDLLPSLQVKLLRALQQRTIERVGSSAPIPVDFRLICATHQDLRSAIAEKSFREDLFYRINVIPISIPALRHRPDDIKPLAQRFFTTLRKTLPRGPNRITPEAINVLQKYSWPGNVRQLRNALEYTLVLCKSPNVEVRDLPEDVRSGTGVNGLSLSETASVPPASEGLRGSVEDAEAEAIRDAVRRHHWKMTNVAKELKISRSTLYQRMQKYGIKRPE